MTVTRNRATSSDRLFGLRLDQAPAGNPVQAELDAPNET